MWPRIGRLSQGKRTPVFPALSCSARVELFEHDSIPSPWTRKANDHSFCARPNTALVFPVLSSQSSARVDLFEHADVFLKASPSYSIHQEGSRDG